MARAVVALRDHHGILVEQRRREIVALAHGLRERRVAQRDAELLRDGEHGVPDHGQGDRIHFGAAAVGVRSTGPSCASLLIDIDDDMSFGVHVDGVAGRHDDRAVGSSMMAGPANDAAIQRARRDRGRAYR